jgi:hypothetical protein
VGLNRASIFLLASASYEHVRQTWPLWEEQYHTQAAAPNSASEKCNPWEMSFIRYGESSELRRRAEDEGEPRLQAQVVFATRCVKLRFWLDPIASYCR